MDEPNGEAADELELDEELEAQWDAEWDEAERDAVAVLREALADRVAAQPPDRSLGAAAAALRTEIAAADSGIAWVARATGLPAGDLLDDAELLISFTAATISPQEDTGLDLEQEAMLISLEHPDWLGAIVSVVRNGPGSDASPEALVDGIRNCPEVVLDSDLDPDDESFLEAAFSIVSPTWYLLGIVDDRDRLTALGVWILPRALARAWNGDFDREPGQTAEGE